MESLRLLATGLLLIVGAVIAVPVTMILLAACVIVALIICIQIFVWPHTTMVPLQQTSIFADDFEDDDD